MPINTYGDFEAQQLGQLRRQEDMDTLRCPKCKFNFFEEVRLDQYQANHMVILGQPVPQRPASVPFILLRCGKCHEMTEPRLVRNARDGINKKYDEFLDGMEAKDEVKVEKI